MADPIMVARNHPAEFPVAFIDFLRENLHVYWTFESSARRVVDVGFKHYSARTIIESMRHHTNVTEGSGAWKLNNNHTPYIARLFARCNPGLENLFDFRNRTS